MREMPLVSKSSAKILFAASEGWNPSQNTYSEAFAQVPTDFELHNIDVSSNPVPQQAFLASTNPASHKVSNQMNINIPFGIKNFVIDFFLTILLFGMRNLILLL